MLFSAKMASKRVGKIASAAVENRTQTPLMSWIRNKLLAVQRSTETPPPAIPDKDGKVRIFGSI